MLNSLHFSIEEDTNVWTYQSPSLSLHVSKPASRAHRKWTKPDEKDAILQLAKKKEREREITHARRMRMKGFMTYNDVSKVTHPTTLSVQWSRGLPCQQLMQLGRIHLTREPTPSQWRTSLCSRWRWNPRRGGDDVGPTPNDQQEPSSKREKALPIVPTFIDNLIHLKRKIKDLVKDSIDFYNTKNGPQFPLLIWPTSWLSNPTLIRRSYTTWASIQSWKNQSKL